jgi:hypothetical protein
MAAKLLLVLAAINLIFLFIKLAFNVLGVGLT